MHKSSSPYSPAIMTNTISDGEGLPVWVLCEDHVIPNSLCVCVLDAQSCPILWDPMDCSLPGSCVLEILHARILEWVVIPFSRGSSWPRDQTWVFHIVGRFFYHLSNQESPTKFIPDFIETWGLFGTVAQPIWTNVGIIHPESRYPKSPS